MNQEIQPIRRRLPTELLVLVGICLLITAYVVMFHYSKAHHLVFAMGRRITPENVPSILEAVAWPLAVVLCIIILRVALRGLIDRIRSASVGGEKGPVINFGEERSVGSPPIPENPAAVEGVTFRDRVRNNVANTYWVGADLMTLFDVVLRGGGRDEMLHMFRQANHHMRMLRIKGAPLYSRFKRLYESAEKSLDSDWAPNRRLEVAREVHGIVVALGRMIEETQPGFSGDPQTSAEL